MERRISSATFPTLHQQAAGAGSGPAERGGGWQWARVGGRCSMRGFLRAAWRLGPAAARGRAGQSLSQAAAGGAEGGGAEGGGGGGSGSREAVERLVRAHPVVVFMKGSPAQPLCGFSNAVVQILRLHGVEDYRAHDVLQDPDLRQGIKNYSNWPTIPQVYLNGEFVGGCDILLQMHQNGDLVEELKKLGIRSALLDAEKDQDKK
ncbi:glutaredoxin-related protein 5, mitochondrial [Grus americana]|nr:glutaredoxin-related protein 5, mitochondrial [Grus americana]